MKSVGQKTSQEKSVYICEICGTKFSSDFTDESEAVLLSDYSRICADIWPLANGSRQICAAIVFCHADFADDADFYSWEGLVPQISQIYTDFSSWDYFCPTDFTDIHRFFMESLVNRFVRSQGVSETTEQVASAIFRE